MQYLAIIIIAGYLALLLVLGILSRFFSRGTSADFFVISRTVGPVLLLLSVFGTTMTGFALVGSTGKAYSTGIAVYGLMASWSGLMHSAAFFLIGIPLWAAGKKHGFLTQCDYFRHRFDSPLLPFVLFPILVLLVIPYLLVGVLSAGNFLQGTTAGMFPDLFPMPQQILDDGTVVAHPLSGSLPAHWGGLLVCLVVLFYVFLGGLRGAVWANAFQTLVFMSSGVVAFYLISQRLGGLVEASRMVAENEAARPRLVRQGAIGHLEFLTYCFIPLSVAMFPHVFQHWLTARSAKTFRLAIIAHPICILIVWMPCILIGVWAAAYLGPDKNPNVILGLMVKELVSSPVLTGVLAAGVLAAIMSSLDSQFVCMGTMFTNDVVLKISRRNYSESEKIRIARIFILTVVAVTYLMSLWLKDRKEVFDLGVWCFSGFAALFPIAFAAIYWRRSTAAGAVAALLVSAASWLFFFGQATVGGAGSSGEQLVHGVLPVTIMFTLSSVAMILVSLLTAPPPDHVLAEFFQVESKWSR
jgi:SSS family solute:Na+ symporter